MYIIVFSDILIFFEQADKLDSVLFSHLGVDCVDVARYPSMQSRYLATSTLLCSAGYRRPWFRSARERLYALSWVVIMDNRWRNHSCNVLQSEALTFSSIASIYPEIFLAYHTPFPSHQKLMALPHALPSSTLPSSIIGLSTRKNRITQLLRQLKQLDVIRGRLQAKIAGKVDNINAAYERPLSSQDKQKVKRNMSLLPLALSVQEKKKIKSAHTKVPRPSSVAQSNKPSHLIVPPVSAVSVEENECPTLQQEYEQFNCIREQLSQTMDHESKYNRWLERGIGEDDNRGRTVVHTESRSEELAIEVSRSMEMLALLEENVGTLFVQGKVFNFERANESVSTAHAEQEGKGGVDFKEIFLRAAHSMAIHDSGAAIGEQLGGSFVSSSPTPPVPSSSPQQSTSFSSSGLLESLLLGSNPPPLSGVSSHALSTLRAKHSSMLTRAAQACDGYCPYEFAHT